jgi:hypothetical protein
MRHYGTAILFALVFSCAGARAEQTVSELLRDYDSAKPEKRLLLEIMMSETENGLNWASVYLKISRKESPLVCRPANLVLKGSQILDMLRREVKEFPQSGEFPYGFAILAADMKAFPCAEKISN